MVLVWLKLNCFLLTLDLYFRVCGFDWLPRGRSQPNRLPVTSPLVVDPDPIKSSPSRAMVHSAGYLTGPFRTKNPSQISSHVLPSSVEVSKTWRTRSLSIRVSVLRPRVFEPLR